jgi:hypothetical protein
VFGKQDNTNTIDLSDIAYGIGGFVINGESAGNQSGYSLYLLVYYHKPLSTF